MECPYDFERKVGEAYLLGTNIATNGDIRVSCCFWIDADGFRDRVVLRKWKYPLETSEQIIYDNIDRHMVFCS